MDRKTENCTGCIYWRHFCGRGANALNACHFILDTGKMRGCTVEECTRKTTEVKTVYCLIL